MSIEPILSEMALNGRSPSADAHDELECHTLATARALRESIPWAGYALCAWDAFSGTHRHTTLASEGYSERLEAHLNDAFVERDPAFRIIHPRTSADAFRWGDYTRDWGLNYPETSTARDFAIPAGFHEGTSMCLRLPDGRYTGLLHVSWSSRRDASDTVRRHIEGFQPLLALVCDLHRSAQIAVKRLGAEANAVLVSRDGTIREMPGRSAGPHLSKGSPLRDLLSKHAQNLAHQRYLWADREHRCHRIDMIPCRGDITLVAEHPIPWPFHLSPREAQILHLIARGLSNPQIAKRLFISIRTAATHVEHLLEKLECRSRTQLATIAVREDLLLATEKLR